MNSWAGDWGKQGYAWLPSEMLEFAEVAFPTKQQLDNFLKIIGSGDVSSSLITFSKKKFR